MDYKKQSTALLVMRILFTFFLAATIVFIFMNSAEIGSLSTLRSARVTAFLNGALAKMNVGITLTEQMVRKLAHFAEYFLLGFWLMLTLRVYTRRLLAFIAWPLLGGLATAVLDEFFQTMVAGRTGQVSDIMINFAGVLLGLCVALFLQLLCSAIFLALRRPTRNAQTNG